MAEAAFIVEAGGANRPSLPNNQASLTDLKSGELPARRDLGFVAFGCRSAVPGVVSLQITHDAIRYCVARQFGRGAQAQLIHQNAFVKVHGLH